MQWMRNMSNAEKIKLIVYVNFGLLAFATVYVIYMTVQLDRSTPSPQDATYYELSKSIKQKVIATIVLWAIVVFVSLSFNMVLLKGVNQRSYTKCVIWFVIYCLGTVVQIYKIVLSFVVMEYAEGLYLLFWASFSLYALYVVKSFMHEIKSDSSMQPLTNKE